MKTATRWAGYVLFFLFCTALFVYLTAPTDQARRFAELKLTEALGAERVEIGDLALSGLGGVVVKGVVIELKPLMLPTAMPNVMEPGPVRILQIARLEVDAGLGALLGGPIDVSFSAEIQAGRIKSGRYQHERGGPHVLRVDGIEDVVLGSEQLFLGLTGMDILGDLSGSLEMTLATTSGPGGAQVIDFDSSVGQADLLIRDARVKSPAFNTAAGRMVLGDAHLGDVALTVLLDRASNLEAFKQTARRAGGDNTIIHITQGGFDGADLAVQLAKNSAITLMPGRPIRDAAVKIHMSVEIKDAFFDKEVVDPRDPSKVSRPNASLRLVMQQPDLRQVTENGIFGLAITGVLGNPRIRPERSVIREGIAARRPNLDRPDEPAAGPRPAPATAGRPDFEDDDDDDDDPVAAPPVQPRAAERPGPVRDLGARAAPIGRATPGVARPRLPTGSPGGAELPSRNRPQPAVIFQPPPPEPEPEPPPEPEPDPGIDPGYNGLELPEGELLPGDDHLPLEFE